MVPPSVIDAALIPWPLIPATLIRLPLVSTTLIPLPLIRLPLAAVSWPTLRSWVSRRRTDSSCHRKGGQPE